MSDPVGAQLDAVRLVVFDVDGTLYRQTPLRRHMARDLLLDMVARRDTRALRVLRRYRATREALAETETPDFDARARDVAARACRCRSDLVDAIVDEWIDRRPLRYLRTLRYPGLPRLFGDLRAAGRRIGVLSDFPVADKLAALGLEADIAVAATDPAVRLGKPHPRGLQRVIELAGTTPEHTLLIGDRWERDGLAAQRAGARVLIRAERPLPACQPRLAHFDDPVLAPLRMSAAA